MNTAKRLAWLAFRWLAFAWFVCCSCSSLDPYEPEVIGTWDDASHRPITLTLDRGGRAVYSSPTRIGAGFWDIDAAGCMRYRWVDGTSPATVVAPFEIADGGDTFVTTAWDEVLTMVRQ